GGDTGRAGLRAAREEPAMRKADNLPPDPSTSSQRVRRPLIIVAGVVAALVVFLLGLGTGGDTAPDVAAEAQASASAAVEAALADLRSEGESAQADVAQEREALAAAEAELDARADRLDDRAKELPTKGERQGAKQDPPREREATGPGPQAAPAERAVGGGAAGRAA